MPAAKPSKAAIIRAIEAVQAAGLVPAAVFVGPDGSLRIETQATPPAPVEGDQPPLDAEGGNVTPMVAKKWATR